MILSALNDYYQRLASEDKVPPLGFSTEQIDYELLIDEAGKVLQVNFIGEVEGKKRIGKPLRVPQSFKRSAIAPKPFFLWDKSSFVLGVKRNKNAKEDQSRESFSDKDHQAFVRLHQELLDGVKSRQIRAFLLFLENWSPSMFSEPLFSSEMLDRNFVFRLDGDKFFVHEASDAKEVQEGLLVDEAAVVGRCLITGNKAAIARIHPSIKGVQDSHTAGGSIVSFDKDAFVSYGKKQGGNSPVSEVAAFGYTTALNYMLRRGVDNCQRMQVGDATVVFWAKARDTAHAEAAEGFFAMLNEPPSDEQEAAKLGSLLTKIAKGRPLAELDPRLEPGTQLFVLGLAPNEARLSVRFWHVDSLERLAQYYAWHHRDLQLVPTPGRGVAPSRAREAGRSERKKPNGKDVPPRL